MKTLNVEIVEKDLSGMKEYCIVSDKADLIYSTYIYEDLLTAWATVNRYISVCERNKGTSAKKSKAKNRHTMILKYISEIQKKNLKAGRHNETCNYFYNGDNTMVVSSTAAAIFPQYLERPVYCPEPQKQGAYEKLEKLFNNFVAAANTNITVRDFSLGQDRLTVLTDDRTGTGAYSAVCEYEENTITQQSLQKIKGYFVK